MTMLKKYFFVCTVIEKHLSVVLDNLFFMYRQDGLNSLLGTMLDLFIAGSDTTSTSLVWAILYMIQHPDIQTRVQEELDSVFGRSSMPNLSATTKELPYTNAVISEMFRKTSLAHMGVPHFALDDCKAGPYNIPKGSTIFQNLYHIHHDPTYWKEPEVKYLSSTNINIELYQDSISALQVATQRAKIHMTLFFSYVCDLSSFFPALQPRPLPGL